MTDTTPTVDELIHRALSKRQPNNQCWASSLTGDAHLLVERLTEMEIEGTKRPNKAEVRRILEEHYGVKISREGLNRHFREECQCQK